MPIYTSEEVKQQAKITNKNDNLNNLQGTNAK
jgi:hypothetical protein